MLLQQFNQPAPAGGRMLAPGEASAEPGQPSNKINRACEAGDRDLTPQMSFIEIDLVGAKQRLEFLFEGLLSMVFFLMTNVPSH
jgi:hypothetical protein